MKPELSNLLVVEDNLFIGKKIVHAAKEVSGIKEVFLTEFLQEAISTLSNVNFKLIVLDLSLPDGNGIELLKWLKEKETTTKVLVFSTGVELKQICLRYGAFAFFDKSKDFDKLIDTLKTLN